MRRHVVPFAAAAFVMGSAASADPFTDAVVRKFQELGFQYIEIERGLTQLRAEGIRGSEEFEVVYDLATGRILRQETDRADADDIGKRGLEISTRNRVSFLDDDEDDEDDQRSRGRDDDDDYDDDEDDRDDDDRDDGDDDDNDED